VKKLQSERAKRYYEKQQQRGKVRIVRWTTQDEKQFLDEFIFPNLPKLVEKWKAQQKEMPENQPEKITENGETVSLFFWEMPENQPEKTTL